MAAKPQRKRRVKPTIAMLVARSTDGRHILQSCDGGKPIGNANMANMLALFGAGYIDARGTTASGRAILTE